MIELNLLPDVKLEYIKAQRMRRLVVSFSIVVAAVSVAALLILLFANAVQKKHINDLTKDVDQASSELKNKPGINRVLTVQNQLNSLGTMHAAKPAAPRLFTYLNQTTPNEVTISNFTIDFVGSKVSFTGSSDSLASVNKYVDTLKFTSYTIDGKEQTSTPATNSTQVKAFKDIVLSSFGLGQSSNGNGTTATYNITLVYDPVIFDNTKDVQLIVPKLTTTRSSVDNPADLFKKVSQPSSSSETR